MAEYLDKSPTLSSRLGHDLDMVWLCGSENIDDYWVKVVMPRLLDSGVVPTLEKQIRVKKNLARLAQGLREISFGNSEAGSVNGLTAGSSQIHTSFTQCLDSYR